MKYSIKIGLRILLFLIPNFGFLIPSVAQFTQYVNPFIGTGGHGHTFPGAVTPFGMVALSPDTRIDGSWDGCSGYHYDDSLIYGFSHTHLSGTGCSDLGDVAFLPMFGNSPNIFAYMQDTFRVEFSHKNEEAKAGYYRVQMDNGIKVELTASQRVGFQRYGYTKDGYSLVILNLKHRDELLEGRLIKINNQTYKGLRRSKAWAKNQSAYFCFNLSKDPEQAMITKDEKGNDALLYMLFKVRAGENILIKTGISAVDEEGAELNLNTEIPHWDFEKTKKEAEATWNKELSCIDVLSSPLSFGKGSEVRPKNIPSLGDLEKFTIFYTAIYHCFIHPSIYNDVDHRYRGRDNQIHTAEGFDYYTVFSLWDTYRALHPLFNIVQRKRNLDFIKTFLAQYDQVGRLPVWELWGNETDCMIGYHAVSVITDAYVHGIRDFDVVKARRAMYSIANSNWAGIAIYRKKGYLEVDDEPESVSKTLEYSYDDWCIDNFVAYTSEGGRVESNNTESFYNARNLYDAENKFFRPRKNGGWLKPFDPREVNNQYTEANGWQYTFATPHLLQYVDTTLLDSLFSANTQTTGRTQSDISGMIGQYAHGNEPSHHIAFLYSVLGHPEKTDSIVKYIQNNFYKNTPDGLIGNEDCGQMSAWYVWAALGKYPVTPGTMTYGDCNPIFRVQKFDSLQAFKWQLRPWMPPVDENLPIIIDDGGQIFRSSLTISIKYLGSNRGVKCEVEYDDKSRGKMKFEYTKPFTIFASATVTASGSYKNKQSVAHFYKIPNDYTTTLISTPRKLYTEHGGQTLTDGLRGSKEWRKGRWLGFQYEDFEAIIDLKEMKRVRRVAIGCLQDSRSWILIPNQITVEYSTNGKRFRPLGSIVTDVADTTTDVVIKDFEVQLLKQVKAKYIKVKATNYGKLPAWHPGKGDEALIFIDEIKVE